MRRIVWFLLVVSGAVGIALLMRTGNGNLAIFWPPYRVDLSVNLAVLLLVLLFIVLHLTFGLLSGALRLPGRMRGYLARRQRDKALGSFRDSLLALLEGRFGRAERLARLALTDSSLAGAAALVGAQAAHASNETARRDEWLEIARASGRVTGALAFSSAEIALSEARAADALELAGGAKPGSARTLHALRVVLRAQEALRDWPGVIDTVRQLERRKAIDPVDSRALRSKAQVAMLLGAGSDPEAVGLCLERIESRDRESPEIAAVLCRALISSKQEQAAAKLIERVLSARFDPELVELWPRLSSLPGRERLARSEAWLQRWGDEPELLSTLGQVCAGEALWGKAETFLLRADRLRPTSQSKLLLACLNEALGRNEESARYYREAARMSAAPDACSAFEPVATIGASSAESDEAGARPIVGSAALPLPGP